jgi:hypothetical protein
VVQVATAVEDDVLDALLFQFAGDRLTDRLRRRDVASALDGSLEVRVERRSRRERAAVRVVDGLRVDVLIARRGRACVPESRLRIR